VIRSWYHFREPFIAGMRENRRSVDVLTKMAKDQKEAEQGGGGGWKVGLGLAVALGWAGVAPYVFMRVRALRQPDVMKKIQVFKHLYVKNPSAHQAAAGHGHH